MPGWFGTKVRSAGSLFSFAKGRRKIFWAQPAAWAHFLIKGSGNLWGVAPAHERSLERACAGEKPCLPAFQQSFRSLPGNGGKRLGLGASRPERRSGSNSKTPGDLHMAGRLAMPSLRRCKGSEVLKPERVDFRKEQGMFAFLWRLSNGARIGADATETRIGSSRGRF